jgi:hypothetical protein
MAWRFVKQPNGLLARFSDIVDNYTHVNMSTEEAISYCLKNEDMGDLQASVKVETGVKDYGPFSTTVGTGHDRWDDCNEKIVSNHGPEELSKILKEIESDFNKKKVSL